MPVVYTVLLRLEAKDFSQKGAEEKVFSKTETPRG
jgi:hypothetical protein